MTGESIGQAKHGLWALPVLVLAFCPSMEIRCGMARHSQGCVESSK